MILAIKLYLILAVLLAIFDWCVEYYRACQMRRKYGSRYVPGITDFIFYNLMFGLCFPVYIWQWAKDKYFSRTRSSAE